MLPSDSPRNGWIRVPSWRDIRRGDIIAREKGVEAKITIKETPDTS
jgi:hypothetical protein